MFIKKKNAFYYILISAFLLSLNSYSQTISLSDFADEIKKDEKKSGADKALKKEEIKLFRDQQKGLAVHFFGSLIGSSSIEPDINLVNANNNALWNWYDNPKYKNKDILKGYDIRISYTKESFIPFGVYAGFGSANLFLGEGTIEVVSQSNDIYIPNKSNYFVFGLSKNLSYSSTLYLGYVQFDAVERTNFLQTTNLTEDTGINIGFSYKLKNIILSIDDILHLAHYKQSQYGLGNKQYEEFKFGHRIQIGLGYLF
jgi:hypothetical protein